MRFLELMTTDGCHLCEHAIAVLQAGLSLGDAEVDLVDIAYEDALIEQYGTRIPVLREPASGRELDWPFGVDELHRFLAAQPGA
jgi:hypothetical protein